MASPTSNTGGADRVHQINPLAETQIQKKTEKKLAKGVERVDSTRQNIHEGEGEKKSEITGETSASQFPTIQTEQPEVDRLKETVVKGKADAHIPRKLERQGGKGNLYGATQKESPTKEPVKSEEEASAKHAEGKSNAAPAKLERQEAKKHVLVDKETQAHVDHFMNGMNLKHLPGEASMGFRDLKQLAATLTNTLNDSNAPSIPKEATNTAIGSYFHAAEPLYRKQAEISKFAQDYQNEFKQYIDSLPTQADVDKLRERRNAIENDLNNPEPSVQQALEKLSDKERAARVKTQKYALREANRELRELERKVEIKNYFTQKPSLLAALSIQQHQRNFTETTGNLTKELNKKNSEGMKQQADGLLKAEKDFQDQIGMVIDVFNDKAFIDLLQPKAEKKAKKGQENPHPAAQAVGILQDLRTAKRELDSLVNLYGEMRDSIHKDPQGWIDALYTKKAS